MKILVSGGLGFIGSSLVRALCERGDTVVVVDNEYAGVEANLEGAPAQVHKLDIRSPDVDPLAAGCDCVVHMAAFSCLPDCIAKPCEATDVNVCGTMRLLDAAARAGVEKFVYASTSAVYEGCTTMPSSEEDEPRPQSVYGISKYAGELLCRTYGDEGKLRVAVARYFNVYGPVQDFRRSAPAVMSAFIAAALRGEQATINGTGEQRRDFVCIDDLTRLNLMLIDRAEADGGVFNAGCGRSHSVNEIFDTIAGLMGSELSPHYGPAIPGEAVETRADMSKAKRLLGWEPRTSLCEGLDRSIEYLRKQLRADFLN